MTRRELLAAALAAPVVKLVPVAKLAPLREPPMLPWGAPWTHPGSVEIVISPFLPRWQVCKVLIDGKLHAGSMEAVRRYVDEANARG